MRNFGNALKNFYGTLQINSVGGTNVPSGLTVLRNGTSTLPAALIQGSGVAGSSHGLWILAGLGAGDIPFLVNNQPNGTAFFQINGLGQATVFPPASGTALTVSAVAGNPGIQINSPSDSQLNLNALTGGQFTTINFLNNSVSKVQMYWDQVNTQFILTPQVASRVAIGFGAPLVIGSQGALLMAAPTAAGSHTFVGVTSSDTVFVQGSASSGASFGLNVQAGSTSADYTASFGPRSGASTTLRVRGDGVVLYNDGAGNLNEIGFRGTPTQPVSTSYTLVAANKGENVQMSVTGQTITIPSGVFNASDVVKITCFLGGGTGSVAIVQGSGMTMYWSGNGAAVSGTRTLASVGEAVVSFLASNVCIISGNAALT